MTSSTSAAQVMRETAGSRRFFRAGPAVTIGTVLLVLAATCVTLFGLGVFDRAVAVYDPSAWLFSRTKGELGRVNGSTAKVDTRVKVNGTAGHRVEVSQTDRYLIVRDLDTGVVSALDLTTLQIAASMDTPPGEGVRVVVHGAVAYVIDSVHGEVRQVDPLTLEPVGAPIQFSPGLRGGEFDRKGQLWLALPTQGTVVGVTPPASAGDTPQLRTTAISQPSHDLDVSVLDSGVAVLDQTDGQLVTVRDDHVVRTTLSLPDQGRVAPRTSGTRIPVTVPDARQVQAVRGTEVSTLTVPGDGSALSPAVAWADWFYIADSSAGVVYVLDDGGALVDTIRFPGQTDLQLDVRDDYLYINAPDGGTARVVNRDHQVATVDKYPNNVPGGDPPPAPPIPPSSPPPTPPVGPPGAPRQVTASAGNATARVTWASAPANGSRILRYVVEGGPQPLRVGADQHAVEVTGLTNGKTYRFRVHAVNAKGSGPSAPSNPVMPTSDVPGPPSGVRATENKDGTVSVTWQAGDGLGHKIAAYQVTAMGPDGPAGTFPAGGDATTLTVPAGTLDYGKQYAFSVVTVNDKGAGSKPSPLSNSVVPYTTPDRVAKPKASTGKDAGTVAVSWSAPATNGRPISSYVISYAGKTRTVAGSVHSVNLTGLAAGTPVKVTIAAVNAAGAGKPSVAVAASPIGDPSVSITKVSVGYNSITVNVSVNDGGGSATCSLAVSGMKSIPGNCTNITYDGLAPGVKYTATVTVSNEVGKKTAKKAATTKVLKGTIYCVGAPTNFLDCSGGIGVYSIPQQKDGYATRRVYNGQRYQVYCKKSGESLNAAQFNHQKKSKMWVRISKPGASVEYVPWIWINLDAGDNLNLLPAC